MVNKKLAFLIALLLTATIISACAIIPKSTVGDEVGETKDASVTEDQRIEKVIFIGPIQVACTGVGPQNCLLLKQNPQDAYSYFYDQITGFTYEPGFIYELLVEETPIDNPPADASTIRWTLLEILSKTPPTSPLDATQWNLLAYMNTNGETVELLPGSQISAEFGTIDLNGNAGCNGYFSSYTIDGDRFYIGLIASTEMACLEPEGLMDQESDYLSGLQKVLSYQLVDEQLFLSDSQGNILFTYTLRKPTELVNTNWQLTGYNNGKGGFSSLIANTEIEALFDDNGNISGNAGCNNYNASYEIEGETIKIGPTASTRKFCAEPEGTMEQESAYLAALQTTASYQINGDQLEIFNTEGGRVASFIVRQTPTLEQLKNANYQSEWTEDQYVQLENGEFHQQLAPDSASELSVYLTELVAYGELVGRIPVAAVVLVTNGGGSGSFYDLAVVKLQDGEPVNVAITQLGDRVQINSVLIVDGKIVVDMVTHADDDPMCCPNKQVVYTYILEGDELVLESSSETITSSEIDEALLNIIWEWQTSLYNNDTSLEPEEPSLYTIEFMRDGQVSIQADCNILLGNYSANGSQISIETRVSTLAACLPGSLENEFLRDLNGAALYFFNNDQLYIDLLYDTGTMRFAPAK